MNKQAYWYRSNFEAPAAATGKRLLLTFKGVNYAAEIWLNGEKLGDLKGAFIRGQFDVTGKLRPGQNALAVKVSPPPHPGIAHEESLTAGVGENGGMMALDGPTFIASEGWDWIPSVRDRNTGLWQDVVLTANGEARLGDAHVVTTLPKADNSQADVEITAPVENLAGHPVQAMVTAAFDGVSVSKTVTLAPGAGSVTLSPAEFPQLSVAHPKLWWPNGYGDPALHDLKLSVAVDGQASDQKTIRFGIRQITYDLSLMNPSGHLRRVEVDFSKARPAGPDDHRRQPRGRPQGRRRLGHFADRPGRQLTGRTRCGRRQPTPYLVIKVNGVKIAARGGNWGTDDLRKRVDRARLAPFSACTRTPTSTSSATGWGKTPRRPSSTWPTSTACWCWTTLELQPGLNLEAQDVPLFLANAADVIAAAATTPRSFCGSAATRAFLSRSQQGLEKLVHDLDGTRWYTGSSNRVNLQNSGPYSYKEPETYFTEHAKGFSVEVGTPSFPTLEAFEAAVPAPDRWPISDTWAYHDWHPTGNGATKSFLDAMTAKLGAPTSLEDFERKAQLMNYETHRANLRGHEPGAVDQAFRPPAVDDPAGLALDHVADPQPRRRHPRLVLRDPEGLGHRPRPDEPGRPPGWPWSTMARPRSLARPCGPGSWGWTARSLPIGPRGRRGRRQHDAGRDAGPVRTVRPGRGDRAAGPSRRRRRAVSNNLYWVGKDAAGERQLSAMAAPTGVDQRQIQGGRGDHDHRVVGQHGLGPGLERQADLVDAKGARILPAYTLNYVLLLPGERRRWRSAIRARRGRARRLSCAAGT